MHLLDIPKFTSCKRRARQKSRRTSNTSRSVGKTNYPTVLSANGSRTMGASLCQTTSISLCTSSEFAVASPCHIVRRRTPKRSDFGVYCSGACASCWLIVDYPSISGRTLQSMPMICTTCCQGVPMLMGCRLMRRCMGQSPISRMYVCGAVWLTALRSYFNVHKHGDGTTRYPHD